MKPLQGKICVVAGATRGAGRGIASMLGEAGATVYCTGRTTRAVARARARKRGKKNPLDVGTRTETIEDTAKLVTALGGKGIAVRCDHAVETQVKRLFARVEKAHGRVDLLVNDVWGGDGAIAWGTPFWQGAMDKRLGVVENVLRTHVITAHHAARLMVKKKGGLIVEITDGDKLYYRGELIYDVVKTLGIRLAFGMSEELRPHGVACVAVTPGFLRSEAMLDHFGVREENWRDGIKTDPHFAASETPWFVGRAIAALARDAQILEKSGRAFSSWGLAREYGFTDRDGSRPDWDKHLAQNGAAIRADQAASHERFVAAFEGR
jgi:NAD(P)-dependent dehydrogenase (short-subunit alcohol dehydrogenase family)